MGSGLERVFLIFYTLESIKTVNVSARIHVFDEFSVNPNNLSLSQKYCELVPKPR